MFFLHSEESLLNGEKRFGHQSRGRQFIVGASPMNGHKVSDLHLFGTTSPYPVRDMIQRQGGPGTNLSSVFHILSRQQLTYYDYHRKKLTFEEKTCNRTTL